MQHRSVKIVATGKYLPKQKVTAQQLADKLDISPHWIARKSGVMTRYFVTDETASYMGAIAAQQALTAAQLTLADIDCIICANAVAQQAIPCTAALVQQHLQHLQPPLGLPVPIPAFDINATCLSFIAALDTLSYLIQAGRYHRILIVSSDIASIAMDWSNHESCTLFGDGAAAAIIEKSSDTAAILASRLETYSSGAALAQCLGGGNKHHPQEHPAHPERFVFQMQGQAIYRMATKILPGFVQRLFEPVGFTMSDMKMVIPHQASLMAMRLLRKQLHIPEQALMVIAHDHGNTVAASIPMALHEAIQQRRIQRGDRILLLGTAAGFSAGAMVLEY